MKALILAGGFATRLWPITEKRAKPLMYINGKPIISHIVDRIPPNFEIIISTNQSFQEEFFAWRNTYPNRKIKIFIEDSGSDKFKKGALGATALVIQQEKITEDLLLLAGDNYFGFSIPEFMHFFKDQPLLAVYDIKDKSEARKYGVVITNQNQVQAFEEKPLKPSSTLVSTGCYIFPQKNLKDIIYYAQEKNDDLGGVFEYMLKQGETIHYFPFNEEWYDIGSFNSYISAHQNIQGNEIIIEKTTKTDQKSQLIGAVYIGKYSSIQNSIIENSIIMNNCQIKNTVIRNCIIDQNTNIKNIDLNHKMIREGLEIKNN